MLYLCLFVVSNLIYDIGIVLRILCTPSIVVRVAIRISLGLFGLLVSGTVLSG